MKYPEAIMLLFYAYYFDVRFNLCRILKKKFHIV